MNKMKFLRLPEELYLLFTSFTLCWPDPVISSTSVVACGRLSEHVWATLTVTSDPCCLNQMEPAKKNSHMLFVLGCRAFCDLNVFLLPFY